MGVAITWKPGRSLAFQATVATMNARVYAGRFRSRPRQLLESRAVDTFAHLITPEAGLIGLFLSAFISATVLPGGSEAVLFALVKLHPEQLWPAFAAATVGNVLGGMSTYALARLLPERVLEKISPRSVDWLQRHGSPALVLSWLPLIGDALCLAAGWLRFSVWPCVAWVSLGKAARYGVVLAGTGLF